VSGTNRVLICNERFLARFGVDRILLLLAEHLATQNLKVEFSFLRADLDKLARASKEVNLIELPEGLDLLATDLFVADQLLNDWKKLGPPNTLVIGGWPFFSLAARCSSLGVKAIFIDAGAVPHDGFAAEALPAQQELRRLRQRTLPYIEKVLPISDFIRFSQSEPDRGYSSGVTTVLLGANHLAKVGAGTGSITPIEQKLLDNLLARKSSGEKLILALGRYETFGYKNSHVIFELLRKLRRKTSSVRILILVGDEKILVPSDVCKYVDIVPTVGDAALREIMLMVSLGLCTSLWEGFNLPLAEMQFLGKVALCFNVGAHPEVVAEPWLLCESTEEMTSKAIEVLQWDDELPDWLNEVISAFQIQFTWKETLSRWHGEILSPSDQPYTNPTGGRRRLVLIDVSNSARDPANSGVIRVTRRLSAGLQEQDDIDVIFVVWNPECSSYEFLSHVHHHFLSSNSGPTDWLGRAAGKFAANFNFESFLSTANPPGAKCPILLHPEVILDGTITSRLMWAKLRGYKTAFIFHDMLPVYETKFVDAAVAANFPAYVEAVSQADGMWSNSSNSQNEFERYAGEVGLSLPPKREAVWLPGQFGSVSRVVSNWRPTSSIRLLCVSTLEPRKNHGVLIEAFQALCKRRPDMQISLSLVGNRYAGGDSLLKMVQNASRENSRITWHGILSDEELSAQYSQSLFTIYPSLAEGFGLPIMESLWMGRPCICHEVGVMAELAIEGGCLTVDMKSPFELSAAIERLASDHRLHEILTKQCQNRAIDTWESYAGKIASRLFEL
jgi:glycosyltransferase involved in cell wall biosynthesis